ncbi:hypothetical protein BD309DRAFT_868893 [Dichomitus squalens]|uniref:Uncharacterized protein n=2 Tax=Dichomitus squalens TaxID=114155 RepID=A0A4Q9NMQ1_9APHY|nr:hypothetical protein BD309DRAFT_868893 [Dichomitus squalens]TBU52021.1 hypothetical protein BD310DRAFT_833109 [Dichomitus squalens]
MSGMTRASLPKPRPPPLDLTDARETYPRLLEQYVGYTEQAPSLADDRINKRTSLPAYLVESYSRIALHNLDESLGAPIPFESRSISQEIMSNYLHDPPIDEVSSSFTHATANTGSNSPDMSAPITPISLVDATAGLMDSEATSTLHSGFGGFEQGHDWAAAAVQNQWMDGETPRGSKQGLMIELGDVVDLAP